jgi:transcriptional regulator with XRE-family HTH domain
MSHFIARLLEKQGNQSSAQFARSLGIDPSNYSRLRNGTRRPSRSEIDAILARWPDLAYWLAEDAKASQYKPPAA